MKILIVSGFLGAGKTTFIKTMAEELPWDLTVMENEYGEVGVDSALLKEEGELNIWELTEGCICCSMKSDFASSILTIANTLNPEYLIVEPTGVGLLSNVIHNIRQIEYERISLLSPVTILDVNSFGRYMEEYTEIMEDQIKAAGTIVISKTDLAAPEETEALVRILSHMNPNARVLKERDSSMGEDWWRGLFRRSLEGALIPEPAEPPELESLGLSGVSLPSPVHLAAFLEELIRGGFGEICRAKGFLDAGGVRLKFDLADSFYSITGFEGEEEPRCVFIGKALKRRELRRRLLPGSSEKVKIRGAKRSALEDWRAAGWGSV